MGRRSIEANPLTDLCGDYLARIEEALKRELDHYSWSEFHAPLRYACDGGKRIRPLILVLSAEAINGRKANGDAYLAASAIELLHTESIIHDDIVDEENTRRGKPSFHIKYGYNSSILTADFVLGIILAIGSKLKNPHVINELSNAATRMSEGEMMEIRLTKAPAITEDDYIKVLDYKTASLFEASAKIGAILAEGSDEQVRAMTSFGHLLGIAYQIHDDLIDWNNEDKLFNMLVKQSGQSKDFIDRMEKLYQSYASRAKSELLRVAPADSEVARHLELMTDLASVQV
ncbi:polyprenyl synthetase family protein [Candidatus Nitrososphaera sp. FF02]|uniref:polyprenyl synthetase family protein n=1 Tax=Candidatus Nitrososphaera sp. FF02 TaxID=3398226 RepID=UPI0039E7CF2A